jgi:N6-L-threonylcarbamoyladenine synthase
MKILAIETSCDETAISLLEATGTVSNSTFTVLGDALYSQASKHAEFGGVYPTLAKREHTANLVPLLTAVLHEAGYTSHTPQFLSEKDRLFVSHVLDREGDLTSTLVAFLQVTPRPPIDAIAVTYGPGLEPALWVGVNVARALAMVWDVPIIPVNHIEGHVVASAVTQSPDKARTYLLSPRTFPILALVISGGHSEFIHIHAWGSYTIVGGTRDDSVGEAFDKVARLLGIPYPGGAGLSALAHTYRSNLTPTSTQTRKLPRPMAHTKDLDLSFSGLKTAVLYWVKELGTLDDSTRAHVAAEFEDAVVDVLLTKTIGALTQHTYGAYLLGGGVSANGYLRDRLTQHLSASGVDIPFLVPAPGLSTDNAQMIGMAAYLQHLRHIPTVSAHYPLRAEGNLKMSDTSIA